MMTITATVGLNIWSKSFDVMVSPGLCVLFVWLMFVVVVLSCCVALCSRLLHGVSLCGVSVLASVRFKLFLSCCVALCGCVVVVCYHEVCV